MVAGAGAHGPGCPSPWSPPNAFAYGLAMHPHLYSTPQGLGLPSPGPSPTQRTPHSPTRHAPRAAPGPCTPSLALTPGASGLGPLLAPSPYSSQVRWHAKPSLLGSSPII